MYLLIMWGILFLVMIPSLQNLIRSFKSFSSMKRDIYEFESKTDLAIDEGELYIILPCHKEQSIVAETLLYFTEMIKEDENIFLVPITSDAETILKKNNVLLVDYLAREWWSKIDRKVFIELNNGVFPLASYDEVEGKRNASTTIDEFKEKLIELYDSIPSTNELIQKWIELYPQYHDRIFLLNDRSEKSNKATKINYALKYLSELRLDNLNKSNTYFAIYDFDSRPHKETFRWLKWKMQVLKMNGSPLPAVFQQIPHQLGTQLEKINRSSLSFSTSIWHLERTLGIEAHNLYFNASPSRIVRACMGAGLFVNVLVLREMGGLPEYNDDISFGYRLDWLNKSRIPIPYPNFSQPTPSTTNKYRQYRKIYSAVFTAGLELEWTRKNYSKNIQKGGIYRIICTYLTDTNQAVRFVAFAFILLFISIFNILFAIATFFIVYVCYSVVYNLYLRFANLLRALGEQPSLSQPFYSKLLSAGAYDWFKATLLVYYFFSVYAKKNNVRRLSIEKTDR